MNSKARRIHDFRRETSKNVKPPPSYSSNSTKEELCMEYVNTFLEQFETVYPKRIPPYMIAENECGVPKFICSTLRPTQLQYSEIYDMHECAIFLAGYMQYEPLDPPTQPPSVLPSPCQSLDWHTGDSFDMAHILCSALIGFGYDAYVVNGYAPKYITLQDQTMTQCPLVATLDKDASAGKASSSANQSGDETEENPYKPPDNEVRQSKYLAMEREKKRLEGLDSFILWSETEGAPEEPPVVEDKIKRVHAWVLVRAGPRDVQVHTFLEPSTGRAYPVSNCPYFGIEAIWNKNNFWVNVENEKAPSQLQYDTSDAQKWERLFLHSGIQSEADKNKNQNSEEAADMFMNQDEPTVETKNPEQDLDSDVIERSLDPPPSWSNPLHIERSKYLTRYPPNGRRTVQYHKAKVDYFAKNQHSQAMVMRVITYLDVAKTVVNEIHEWFENRRDKMYKRVRYVLEGKFVEDFFPGSLGEVKKWVEYPGKSRNLDFYVSGRLDRMTRREEIIGESISEYFDGRTDFLTYRSMILSLNKEKIGTKSSYSYILPANGLGTDLYVLRISQTFDKDPSVTSGSDIAQRTFYLTEGRILTQFHFVNGKITQKVKVHSHAKSGGLLSGSGEELSAEDLEGIQEAALVERECFSAVKMSYIQMMNIIKIRNDVEDNVGIERTVFENALDRAEKGVSGAIGVEENDMNDSKGVDYLTPFLRHIAQLNQITKEEALEVRQSCLDALKARLVERANIIQSRLNEENTKLARKQEQFQRSQREGDLSTEEYEKYCTEAMFRIQILEQRLVAHEESALKKFSDLDIRLAADQRLKVLRVP